MIKKFLSIILSFTFCGLTMLLAQDQNLVELAKKERERRESLKGQKVKVVTNRDLETLTKTPAFILKPPAEAETAALPEGEEQAGEEAAGGEMPPSVVHRVTVETPPTQPSAPSEAAPADQNAQLKALEESWKKAQEYVELLTLKMNSLWQEFYSLSDMKSRDYVQQQISETYEKLLKAQEEESRLRMEYENYLNRKKSESAPPLWIR